MFWFIKELVLATYWVICTSELQLLFGALLIWCYMSSTEMKKLKVYGITYKILVHELHVTGRVVLICKKVENQWPSNSLSFLFPCH